MPGLLDFLDTLDGQLGIGLLAAAGPSMVPMGLGQRIAQGMQYVQDQKQNALRSKYLQAQVDETMAQAAERKQRAEAEAQAIKMAQARQAALPTLFSGGQTQGSLAVPESNGVPMFSQGVQVNQASMAGGPSSLNWRAALAAGFKPEEIAKLAELPNIGRQEVARTIEAVDDKGRPVTKQFDKYGQMVGGSELQWKQPMTINQGDRTTLLNPATLQTLGSLTTNMSASERDASARGWASQRLAAEQAAKPQYHDGAWVTPPTASNPRGGFTETANYVPPKGSQENIRQSSTKAVGLIDHANKLLDSATGSWLGTGIDQGAALFGASTQGAQASAKLKALEGSLMMAQPRMEGPQSDKDTQLYRQMAAQLGDSTVPVETRRAALETIRELHQKYAGPAQASPATQSAQQDVKSKFVDVGGKKLPAQRADNGKFYVQQNGKWFEVKE